MQCINLIYRIKGTEAGGNTTFEDIRGQSCRYFLEERAFGAFKNFLKVIGIIYRQKWRFDSIDIIRGPKFYRNHGVLHFLDKPVVGAIFQLD